MMNLLQVTTSLDGLVETWKIVGAYILAESAIARNVYIAKNRSARRKFWQHRKK